MNENKLKDQISSFKHHRSEIMKILRSMLKANPNSGIRAKISIEIRTNDKIIASDTKNFHWV